MREWEANRAQKLFNEIAEEIRTGALQSHFANNSFLFSRTDEILHFALQGEKLTLDSEDYQEKRKEAVQEILSNTDKITESLSDYPDNDCQAVRESVNKIKLLVEQIK